MLEDLAVGIEQSALAAQFFESGVRDFVKGVELVEGFDEEGTAAAGGVEDAEAFEHILPGFPELDEHLALRFVERGEIVNAGIGQRLARGGGGGGFLGFPQGFETAGDDGAERLLDDVAGDERRGVKGSLLFPPGLGVLVGGGQLAALDVLADALEVGDGLLEDVAEDVHVDDGADFLGQVALRDLAGGAEVVSRKIAEQGADVVRNQQGIEAIIVGEKAAVVGGDFQPCVPLVHGAKEAAEVVPDGLGVVGIAVVEGTAHGLLRQQAAVLAERAEQDAVQQFLRTAEDFLRQDGWILRAEPGEDGLPEVRLKGVELVGDLAPDGFGFAEQLLEMALAGFRHHAGGTEQEYEALEQTGIAGKPDGVEALVGLLVRALVIEPGFPHGGDDDPVAGEIDGVAVTLIDCGHLAPAEGDFERVASALALDGDDEFGLVVSVVSEHGIRPLPVHLHDIFPGHGVGVTGTDGAGVAKQRAKDVSQEIGQELLFIELVRSAG